MTRPPHPGVARHSLQGVGSDYDPTPDVAPAQAILPQATTSRTSISARTMSALTSETGRSRGRRVPTRGMVGRLLLLVDLITLGVLSLLASGLSGVLTNAWSGPMGSLLPLGITLLGTLSLVDANHINLRERFWRLHASILLSLATAIALGLGAGYAVGWWQPQGVGQALSDRTLLIAITFVVLALVNRSLLRRWMLAASGRASWLLVARRDSGGIDQFWADFRNHSHGRLMFLADAPPSRSHSRPMIGEPVAAKPPVAGQWQDLRAQFAKAWSGIIVVDAALLDADTVRAVMEARLCGTPVLSLEEFYEYNWHRVPVFLLRSEWFALSRGFEILRSPVQSHIKRGLDMLLAGSMLLFAVPLMVAIVIGV